MQKRLFLKNGAIMAGSALIIRSLGMMFRVYLADSIGSEGLGIYQLILTAYAFFAMICTSGLTITVTRLAGDYIAEGRPEKAGYVTEKCLIFSLILSSALGLALFLSADKIGTDFLHDERTVLSLRVLAPSLPFMAFSAVLRGYFSAKRKMLRTAGEQLLEQTVEIAVCVSIFTFFSPKTIEYACCSVSLGTTCAEILSFVYSFILYAFDKKRLNRKSVKVERLFACALPIALPCMASSGLRSGLSAIENILIPSGLIKYGADSSTALSEYGIISGMAMTVIVFPSVFILPFASLIIPEMSQASILHHNNGIKHMAERMFSATLKYSLPIMFIFIFFADGIGRAVYNSEKAGFYIAALAPVVPLMYLDSSVDGMLKGLNEQTSYLICNVIDSIIRVILTYLLLPVLGAMGVVIVIIFSELLNTSLSLIRLMQVTHLRLKVFDSVIRPIICILIPCLLLPFLPKIGTDQTDICIRLILCIAFYFFGMFISAPKDSIYNKKIKERSAA